MTMNAKQELLDIVNTNNLTILKIDLQCEKTDYDEYHNECGISMKPLTSLDDLNFEYNSGYGLQHLFGTVYCKDSNNNPVWLTRGEYDGSEWWNINTIPEFYNTIK